MVFYRLKEIPSPTRSDTTFRYPVGLVFLAVLVLAGLFAAVFYGVGPAAGLPEIVRTGAGYGALATVALGFLLMGSRLNPRAAWLARITGDGLTVKFRSPRNHRAFSKDDVVAFRLGWDEIAWAIPAGGAEHALRDTHLEMKLVSRDLLPLKMHLGNERTRQVPPRRHFWSIRRKRVPHHPVQFVADGVLRIEWKVRPGLKKTVEMLRDRLSGENTRPDRPADAAPAADVRSEQEELTRILHLARTGDMMGAFVAAGEAFGLAECDAEGLVEALADGRVAPDRPETTSAFLRKAATRDVLLRKAKGGDFMGVQGALVRDYGFALEEAADLAGALTEMEPDKARRHLNDALARRPARSEAWPASGR